MNKHMDAILACRVQGGRLYGKPLQHLVDGGITVIECLLEYLKKIKSIRHIILAISNEPENEGFVRLAEKYDLPFVKGDQKDVLGRMLRATELFGTEYIFRTTSECPFVLYEYADALIEEFMAGDYDRGSVDDSPEGTGFELIRTEALRISHAKGEDRHRSELVTSYMFDNQEKFRFLNRQLPHHLRRPEVRLTVDYAEDLIFCQQVYRALHRENDLIKVETIIDFWDNHPDLRRPLEEIGIDWGHGRLWK